MSDHETRSLPPDDALANACAALEQALRVGQACMPEALLKQYPQLKQDSEARLELLYFDFVLREELGLQPDPSDYLQRFPDCQTELQRIFELHLQPLTQIDPDPEPAAILPTPVDPTIDAMIGQGGISQIFRIRDPKFDRHLALKTLRPDRAAYPSLHLRLLQEARVMGWLQHPNIPPVFQHGQLADGRPYFTLKLIHGRDWDQRLAERTAPTDDLAEQLSIFEQVCQAVGYAHRQGIIHRDLKPHNVMVGRFGEVQVMDWGLAKRLDRNAPDAELSQFVDTEITHDAETSVDGAGPLPLDGQTQPGSVLGTLAYMAPEQANGQIDQVDAQSDVFGLGAILCQLLTGQPAYTGNWQKIQQQAQQGDRREGVARLDACAADPELITLAKRCLNPTKADRPSDGVAVAEAIAGYRADVQRRLQQERIERERQQVRAVEQRRKLVWQLSLAGVVLLGVILLAWWRTTTIQAAVRDRREAEQTFATLKQQLAGNDPWQKPRAFDALRSQLLPDGPEDLRHKLADSQEHWQTVETLDQIRQDGMVWTEDGFDWETMIQRYAQTFRQRELDIARDAPEALAERIRSSPIRKHLLATLDDWAKALHRLQKYQARDRVLAVTLKVEPDVALRDPKQWTQPKQIEEWLQGADDRTTSASLVLLVAQGIEDATLKQRWLEAHYLRHPDWFDLLFELGYLAWEQARWQAAIGYYRAALAIRPNNHAVWHNLGSAYKAAGKPDQAAAAYRKAIQLRPNDGRSQVHLGIALYQQQQFKAAIAAYRRGLALAPDHAHAHTNLGVALLLQGDRTAAIAAHRKAIELNPKLAAAYDNLGIALMQDRQPDAAIAAFRAAVQLESDNPQAHSNLGKALAVQRQFAAAIAEFHRAIELQPKDVMAHWNLGIALLEAGKFREARTFLVNAQKLAWGSGRQRLPFAKWIGKAEALQAQEDRWQQIRSGAVQPVDAMECIQLAEFCLLHRRRYAAAVSLYRQGFRREPQFAEKSRYNVACAALRAAGQPRPASTVEADPRGWYRCQALAWLRKELLTLEAQVTQDSPNRRGQVARTLAFWRTDPDLTSVRSPWTLAVLSEPERLAWRRFWQQAATLSQQVTPSREPSTATKTP